MTWHVLGRNLMAAFCTAALGLGAINVHAMVSMTNVSGRAVTAAEGSAGEGDGAIGSDASPATPDAPAPVGRLDSHALRDTSTLVANIQQLISESGATVGVTLVELRASDPVALSVNGHSVLSAASTYKLAALMLEAENVAAGRTDPNGAVCFQPDDYEAGWFDDYGDGVCLSRNELATRAGRYSDNTAGHMLVRDVGGAAALNDWAASHGTTSSAFFVGNTTTSDDLAALWVAEADGTLGGAAAQAWLYPFLTDSRSESGVPAGVPGVAVVHKTGSVDAVDNDAALVTAGHAGPYVLAVMTDGSGGAAGWQLIANISAIVGQFEAAS